MSHEELKELMEIITALRIEVAKVNEKLDALKQVSGKLDAVEKVATEALSSVKSAHHRIDRIDKVLYWLGTTVIGSLITAVVLFIVKGGFAS